MKRIAIGAFDGLHIGHLQLIRQADAIFTFPMGIKGFKYITSQIVRERILSKLGVPIILQDFHEKFRALLSEEFIRMYVVEKLRAERIVVGENFMYGSDRQGVDTLVKQCTKHGVECVVVPLVEGVSSTRVRELILDGNLEVASQMCGRPLEVRGCVVPGQQRGRLIGIPTANMKVDPNQAMPPHGVYATSAEIDGVMYKSITNYGGKPTFEGHDASIETHIIDYDGEDLYDKEISVYFHKKIRDVVKFSDAQALISQINEDIATVEDVVFYD